MVKKLTKTQVAQIVAKPWERGSGKELAREFGVTESLISQIRGGLRYAAEDPAPRRAEGDLRPRGMVHCENGRFWARLSLGAYDTYLEAERANTRAIERLGG